MIEGEELAAVDGRDAGQMEVRHLAVSTNVRQLEDSSLGE